MKAERRKTVVSIADVQQQDGIGAWFRKHGNTLLTGILIALAVALLVRWRLNSAFLEKQDILSQLHEARATVDQLHNLNSSGSPADLIKAVQTIQTDAGGKLSDVLNRSTDSDVKAQALVVRGDLDWQLANLPELPGAASEASLRLSKTSDELLGQAADAYGSVVNSSEFAGSHESVNAARLGLAAVAENRHDWVGATRQLQAIKDDPNASGVKQAAADIQLALISDPNNSIEDPVYVAPPVGTPSAIPPVSSLPTTFPALPTTFPALPTTLPATFPAMPSTPPAIPATLPMLSLPATKPVH